MPRRDQQQSCRASKGPRRLAIHLGQNRNPVRVLPPKNGIRFHEKSIPHLQNFCCVLFAALLRSLRIEGATRHQATALTRRQPDAPTRGSCRLDSGFGHPSANPHLHWASLGSGTNHIIGCVVAMGSEIARWHTVVRDIDSDPSCSFNTMMAVQDVFAPVVLEYVDWLPLPAVHPHVIHQTLNISSRSVAA